MAGDKFLEALVVGEYLVLANKKRSRGIQIPAGSCQKLRVLAGISDEGKVLEERDPKYSF